MLKPEKRLIFIYTVICLNFSQMASGSICSRPLSKALQHIYFEKYDPEGACYKNAVALVHQMQIEIPSLDLGKVSVLVITKRSPDSKNLVAIQSRQALDPNGNPLSSIWDWRAHFSVELEGLVYDPDFSFQPTPIGAIDYIDEMFFGARIAHMLGTEVSTDLESRNASMRITVVPAKDYLAFKPETNLNEELLEHMIDTYPGYSIAQFKRRFSHP